ncbi:hypothetical protein EZJ49_04540 [Bdellovibrio bacteriovorus]|uniref:hypothetical protein n=1 Tax=Bdellovibrio bacteriovorus TaxID=959 RepID=UPI0021D190CB|nr:hypothetical protein [Bdellovibrio bacteriovorus]UXR65521.1 hypothetical protein EZJ49_04540 [Bdellovibrio bacteriovorus]
MNVLGCSKKLILRFFDLYPVKISLLFLTAMVFSSCTLDSEFAWQSNLAPIISFSDKPQTITNQTSANFVFTIKAPTSRPVASVECSIDGSVFAACSSPLNLSSLDDGEHRLQVTAVDDANNRQVATITWTVDTVSPVLSVQSTPATLTKENSATFEFTATDDSTGVALYECEHTSALAPTGSFKTCSSLVPLVSLNQDVHTYRIRAKDAAGNISNVISYTWTVDLTAPVITISSAPATATTSSTATFSFTNTETGGAVFDGYECKLDSADFSACISGISFSSLSQGSHNFQIRAKDTAGNISAPTSVTWVVDSGTPTLDTFSIADGAGTIGFAYTTTQITATPVHAPISHMRFSENSSFTGATWLPYNTNGTFTLSNTGGSKTVYAQVKNAAGTVSNIRQAAVTLDLGAPPTVVITAPATSGVYSPASTMTIEWSCSPGGSIPLDSNPIKKIQYSVDDGLSYHLIAQNLPNNKTATTGDFSWTVPNVTPTGQTVSASTPLRIIITCSSAAGVVASANSKLQNSVWTSLLGEPGNLNEGVHINAADLGANNTQSGTFFSDSNNRLYYTKGHAIVTVNSQTGLISSWIGDTYKSACDAANVKLTEPYILDINSSDEMILMSTACSLLVKVKISDKSVVWSKQLPQINYLSPTLKDQSTTTRYVKTGHLLYYSDHAIYQVDLNSTDRNPIRILGTPGSCGPLGAMDTLASSSLLPCPETDLYMFMINPDASKIWIRYSNKTLVLEGTGTYGSYKLANENLTTGGWGSPFNRCAMVSTEPNKIYCMRGETNTNTMHVLNFETEIWSSAANLNGTGNLNTIFTSTIDTLTIGHRRWTGL